MLKKNKAISFIFCTLLAFLSSFAHAKETGVVSPDLFGLHVHRLSPNGSGWPALQIGFIRMWDSETLWRNMEPEKGRWNFDRSDIYVDTAVKNNTKIIFTLGQTPLWAARDSNAESPYGPGSSSPPKDIKDWDNYVETLAKRYKGKVFYWEIWNEVNSPKHFKGGLDDLKTLAQHAYRILKAIDPKNVVLSPSIQGGAFREFDEMLKSGVPDSADVISYHFYAPKSDPEEAYFRVNKIKSIMQKNGYSKIPLWNTEVGWLVGSKKGFSGQIVNWAKGWAEPTAREVGAYIVRTYLLALEAGIGNVSWYAWDNGVMGLHDHKTGIENEAASGYRTAYRWLVGTRFEGCKQEGDFWYCNLERDGKKEVIAWVRTGSLPIKKTQFNYMEGEFLYGEKTFSPEQGGDVLITSEPLRLVLR